MNILKITKVLAVCSLTMLSSCKNEFTINDQAIKTTGIADGTGDSLMSSGQTSVTVTVPEKKVWNSFTINLGADYAGTNICSGKTIFGKPGSALCVASAWTVSTLNLDSTNIGAPTGTNYSYSAASNIAHNVINLSMGADFTASNLCNGKLVLGLSGTAACVQGSTIAAAAAGDIFLNKEAWLSNGTKVTGTMPNNSTWDLRTAFPSAGYFAAISNAPTAAKLCNSATGGQDVLGVSGTGVCLGASGGTNAVAGNVLTGTYFWNASGTSTQGTMTDHGSLNLDTTTIPIVPTGYYSDITSTLTASDICTGKSIFGSAGTAVCNSVFGDLTASNMARNVATAQMTLTTEKTTSGYAAGYRDVPAILKDDDGYYDSSQGCTGAGGAYQTCTTVVKAARPAVTCGTTQNTISARVTHCASQNGANATWTGANKGISGESTWKLVTRTAGGKEVWRDERTELLWGDYIANDTWCKATGNGEVDPSGYCTGNTQSYCAEGGSRIKALAGEDWTTGVYDATKGGMGAVATASSPSVRWRLPTRNDWYIAEADGIRYVLPNMLYSFWSATVYSNARVNAWVFDGYVGGMNLDNRSNSNSVRCLGR